MLNRNTIESLGIWGWLMNPDFNCAEFGIIKSQALNSQIKDRLLSLLKTYPNTITRQMGFPRGWENEPLWQ